MHDGNYKNIGVIMLKDDCIGKAIGKTAPGAR
jgi:hypothetical protein